MPTEKKRIQIIPDPGAMAAVGIDVGIADNLSSYAIGGVIGRYADLVRQASRELGAVLNEAQWNLLADVLNGCADVGIASGGGIPAITLITAEVEDAQRLNRIGEKWLLTEKEEKLPLARARTLAAERVSDLVSRLAALTPAHGVAILAAVRWFWDHPNIDHTTPWWTAEYREAAMSG